MTVTTGRRVAPPGPVAPAPRSKVALAALVISLAAGGVLMTGSTRGDKPAPKPGRLSVAAAWPKARQAEIPGSLPDGPYFTPTVFLDANTAVGTASSADGRWMRLVLRTADGQVRQLHRLPTLNAPQFDDFAVNGDTVVWTQTSDRLPMQIWSADLRSGMPAHLLTADTGDAVFYGNQYDFVFADGRMYWVAAGPGETTEIRSVPLTGGPVTVRPQQGEWALSAWPWLSDDAAGLAIGTTELRNLSTGHDLTVRSAVGESATCTPTWCQVMVMNSTSDLIGIDIMHPDGSARRHIAGAGAQATVNDVAVLDRFEILNEPGPNSDLTGIAKLLAYDISTERTVEVSPAANRAFIRNGVLWWSTGDDETVVWHTVDLRTA